MSPTIKLKQAHSADLRTSLLVNIALVAATCLVIAAALSMLQTGREATSRAETTAAIVGQQLDLQLLRIATGIDAVQRFPDWDGVIANLPMAGQCIELRDTHGALIRSHCAGSSPAEHRAPEWFATAWKHALGGLGSVERAVQYHGRQRGSIHVSADSSAIAGRAWQQMLQLVMLTALIVIAISAFVFRSVGTALAPAAGLMDGLEQMAGGSFQTRLPPYGLRELDRIGEGVNKLAAMIEATLAERADLMRRLMSTQEDERRILAGELHDEYGQKLTAVAALAASIETSAATNDPDVAAEARTIGVIAAEMMHALRGTLQRLRPVEIESFGLGEGLRQLIERWNGSRRNQTRFTLDLATDLGPLKAENAMHIYRIAQEAVTNAARHANARKVSVCLQTTGALQGGDLCLVVEDDGTGSVPYQNGGAGIGLLNMRERVTALGGTIAFDNLPSGGLRVRVVVPSTTKQNAVAP
jgi:two-component system sensor histidine kinase UhpB